MYETTCYICGADLKPARRTRQTCSNACRQAAYRKRQADALAAKRAQIAAAFTAATRAKRPLTARAALAKRNTAAAKPALRKSQGRARKAGTPSRNRKAEK